MDLRALASSLAEFAQRVARGLEQASFFAGASTARVLSDTAARQPARH